MKKGKVTVVESRAALRKMYTVSRKNVAPSAFYNFDKYQLMLIIF